MSSSEIQNIQSKKIISSSEMEQLFVGFTSRVMHQFHGVEEHLSQLANIQNAGEILDKFFAKWASEMQRFANEGFSFTIIAGWSNSICDELEIIVRQETYRIFAEEKTLMKIIKPDFIDLYKQHMLPYVLKDKMESELELPQVKTDNNVHNNTARTSKI